MGGGKHSAIVYELNTFTLMAKIFFLIEMGSSVFTKVSGQRAQIMSHDHASHLECSDCQ